MRGLGRVFRPKVRGRETVIWWLDFTVDDKRYRESAETTDYKTALRVLEQRRKERRDGAPTQAFTPTALGAFVVEHLKAKRATRKFTDAWLEACEQYLARATAFFGEGRQLASITAPDIGAWSASLQDQAYAPGSVLHHLGALSNLFRRARAMKAVPTGHDPVGDFDEKPERPHREAKWLEVSDAALLLEAARRYKPDNSTGGRLASPFAFELIATFLLTGGREAEVLGLEVSDVSFDRKTVTFRPNDWRRLKTKKSHRVVPLWPQLEEILRPYVFSTDRPPSKLLFPSWRTGEETMLTDFRKLLDAVAERASWKAGEIRSKQFRHTYITARLQTLDRGAPVSTWTVAREVGHSSTDMIEETYGHLGQVRHRAELVEYRIEQHAVALQERLARLCLPYERQTVQSPQSRKSLRVASSAG